MKISYSGQSLMKACEKRFFLEKVAKASPDADYADDFTALQFGTAFHYVLEHSKHDHKLFSEELLNKAMKEAGFDDFAREIKFKVYACLTSYYKLRKASGLTLVASEYKVGDDDIVGYADAILTDSNQSWSILDNKTSGWVQPEMFPRLTRDPQLNLYAAYAADMAKTHGLDLEKFTGIRYNVVQKPKHVVKKDESMKDYCTRSNPACYEVFIPKEQLVPSDAVHLIKSALAKAKLLTEETAEPNYSNCLQYNRPCPFWSRCYGVTYSDSQKNLKVFDQETMVDQTHLLPVTEEKEVDPLLSDDEELAFLM